MKYWRCRMPRVFEALWPMFGHLVRPDRTLGGQMRLYCERCPWSAEVKP